MIVAFGDLTTDVVVRRVDPIAHATDTPASISFHRGGSSANVCAVSSRLGRAARFVGALGDDPASRARADDLRSLGVEVSGPSCERGVVITVLVDAVGERSFLTDRGVPPRWSDVSADEMDGWLDGATRLHLSGYAVFDPSTSDVCAALASRAHARDIPVSFDPSSVALFASVDAVAIAGHLNPDIVLPNSEEDDAVAGAWPGIVLRTNGSRRAELRVSGEVRRIPLSTDVSASSERSVVVDTTGAGDAFAAGVLAVLDERGVPGGVDDRVWPEAVRAGHRAALAVIGGAGADAWHPVTARG